MGMLCSTWLRNWERVSTFLPPERPHDNPNQGRTRNTLFFEFLTALRLRAPIGINIAGAFEVGEEDLPIMNPELFLLQSPWQPKHQERYSGTDFDISTELYKALSTACQDKYRRLKLAVVLFSQVTIGFSKSYQMAYLTLFVALEALFAPTGNKAKTLASRVSSFLEPFDSDKTMKDRLEDEYKTGRSSLSHGIWSFSPNEKMSEDRQERFGYLHEITRLSILGFLSMGEIRWAGLSQSGTKLHRELDSLGHAKGKFIQGQSFWLL